MPICAVIFDMDGLMLDTEPIYKIAWQRAAIYRPPVGAGSIRMSAPSFSAVNT